jgi:hypothetical protein
MQLNLVERDIKIKEEALRRCTYNLDCLRRSPRAAEYQEGIKLMDQEAFYLQDQLNQYYVVQSILREEQGVCDEMLPKA